MIKIAILLTVFFPSWAFAVVTINNSTKFPYNATVAGETYRLSENVSCPTTCITMSSAASNAVIDLNGYTMTFGTANAVTVANADFENWTGSTPNNWTVVSGSVSSTAATDWGNYDLSASNAFTIRSDAFTLNGGQTYQAWAFVRGSSSASGVLRILNASDNSVITSQALSGSNHFSRGFAVYGEENNSLQYKPSSNISVKLELETTGAYTYRVAEVNMAPKSHHGIVARTSSYFFPDITGQGSPTGITVQNGTITQGNGKSTYSSAIIGGDLTVNGVTINVSGPNSGGVFGVKTITSTTINSSVTRVFNRMYGTKAAGVTQTSGYTRAISIDGLTVNDFPQYGTIFYNCPTAYDNGGSVEIKNSTFKNKGVVTEPYAMAFSGAKNISVHHNVINPNGNTGRGILIDAVGCTNPQIEGVNGNIYSNQFLNIYEDANLEYGTGSLEAVGIRIRNWGGTDEGHKLNIYDNTFNYTNNTSGSHAIYGLNISSLAPGDEFDIYNNSITVNNFSTSGTEWAAGIALQDFGNASATRHKIRNNTITTNSYGIGFSGNDDSTGAGTINAAVNSNIITASVAPLRFGMGHYGASTSHINVDIYCNQITNNGSSGYPFYFNGTISDILIDYNQITNSNSGGFEAWADANESTDILFYGNGQIDVTGGGSVGAAGSATNGSASCYTSTGGAKAVPSILMIK